ncbi:hypothetical protein FKZ61_005025 [Litorilinea aerophila]|nr:YbaK/EbsC family protein [Litorilinea aerophila]MCC9075474.1 hypothetical protein [Litorilinea aerophila]
MTMMSLLQETSPPPLEPRDLQNFIEAHGIAARLLPDIGHTPTVPAAAQVLGVHPDQIIKTLLFVLEAPATDTPAEAVPPYVVVISHGERRVDRRALAARWKLGRKRVKLAPPDVVLDVLGYPAGGVPPFGHRTALPVLLDAGVMSLPERHGELVYGGGGNDRTMLEIPIPELLRVICPEILPLGE